MSYKLIIFDLDDTLISVNTNKLYNDVEYILNYLKDNRYKIALASYNSYAHEKLRSKNIYEYFDIVKCEDWRIKYDKKDRMLNEIVDLIDVDAKEVLFVDDNNEIVEWAKCKNFNVCKVDPKKGINIIEIGKYIPDILKEKLDENRYCILEEMNL